MAEGTTIGKAYVQIMPSTEGMKNSLTQAMGGEAEQAGASAGNSFASKFKSFMIKAGIATAFTKVLKSALSEGADLQQSYMGGVSTLYEDAADTVRNFAKEASKYGISMNDYSEQAVSFGAALKQAYGGEAVKAADAANMAIQDMADNQAKMGTSIESIQDAYQGFAKQNYTMLDNLKLGYGGTKTEMERLLAEAEKLSGVKYDISNLGDVYSAIHFIQDNLGLTGAAAEEASTTFSGSLGAMKAAASNFLGSLALGQDIKPALDTLLQSVDTFVNGNLLPMLGTIGQSFIDSLPSIISGISGIISSVINYFVEHREELVTAGGQLIDGIIEGITGKSSTIGETISGTLNGALTALGDIIGNLSAWWDSLDPGMQGFITKAVEVAIVAIPMISAMSSIASTVSPLVSAVGGIASKFTSFGSAATAAVPGTSGLSSTLGTLTQNALGLVAAGAGILMAAAGIALLADAAIKVASAGPGAAIAMVAITAAVAGMAIGAAALAPALTAGAVGLVAFGAGITLIGVGILAATSGIALMATQLPTIVTYGSSAAVSITKLAASLTVFAVGSAAAAVSLVATDVAFAAFAVSSAAAAIGVAALDIAMAALAVELVTIAGSASSASKDLQSMVSAVDIVNTGLSSLKSSVENAVSGFISAFTGAVPSATAAATTLANSATTAFKTSILQLNASMLSSMTTLNSGMITSMTTVYSTISRYMDMALNKIRDSIGQMQQAFANTQFSFNQSIRLPHFSLSGSFDAQTGQVPSVGVDWYAKGGILTQATIFGLNGSQFTGGGESGPEAVLPISTLKSYITDALDEYGMSEAKGYNQTINITSPKELSASEVARQTRNATKQMVLSMKGV